MSKKFRYPKIPIIGVGVVVFRNNEVLLVKRGNDPNKGKWSIPGGRQKLAETIIQTVHRELEEETGVKVKNLEFLDVVDMIVPDDQGKIIYHYTLLDFQGNWESGVLRPGGDSLEVQWFELNKLKILDLKKITSDIIFKAAEKKYLV